MSPAPNPSSRPPSTPASPVRNSKHAHHHQTLTGLISKVFSPSNNRREKQQEGNDGSTPPTMLPPPPSHAQQSRNTETEAETDSAYRDLGIDPDRLTVFNIARDCGKSRSGSWTKSKGKGKGKGTAEAKDGTKSNALFSNLAAATTTADLPVLRSGEGSDAGTGDRSSSVPAAPPMPSSSSTTTSPLGTRYPQLPRRSWRWNSKRSERHKKLATMTAPPPSRFVEDLVDDDNGNPNNSSSARKGKGKMPASSVDLGLDIDMGPSPQQHAHARLPMIEPTRRPPPPPPPKPRTTSELLQAREQVRLERRTLKESGDWLGVQGADPWTGEMDVLTPTNTVSTSSGSLPSANNNNNEMLSASGSTLDIRRLLDGIVGRRRAAERSCDRAREMEARSRGKMNEAREVRDRAKLAKIERRKEEEGWRVRRELMSGGSGSGGGGSVGGGGSAVGVRRWKQHRDQWSSIAEPNLSPIAQSVSSSANNINEPPPSSGAPPTDPVPNYSWPIQSPEAPRYGRTASGSEYHQRSQSTDTIIHNHMKNKTASDLEPQPQAAGRQTFIAKANSISGRIQDPGPSNQTPPQHQEPHQEEEKHFLWRRRRRMTDPGGQDSKSPVMVPEITTPPPPALTSSTTISTMQTQEPDLKSPANHFRGLVIPDYRLHLLTPEPEERSRTELRTTGEASIPSPLRISDQDRREGHRQSNECPTNGAIATSSPLKSKEPMRRHSIHRKPISTKPGRLASRKESAIRIPLASSRSLDTQRNYVDEQLSRRNGLEVSPSEQQDLALNLKNGSSSVVDDDIRQVHADRRNNFKDVVVDIDAMSRNHSHRGVELLSGNTSTSNASQHTTRSLLAPSATRGRRFAFIPTTTTTGYAREHDHGHDQDHNQREYGTKENRVPTPPPWALRTFQVDALLENTSSSSSSSSEDQVTRTSLTPSPPRTLTTTIRTTPATTIATETTESEHTTAMTDEDVMMMVTWQPEKKNAASPKTSPGLRRISRPIPPRRSSLSCVAAPLGNVAGDRLDMMVPGLGQGRGRGTDITSTQPRLTHDPTSNGKEATARSVSLPVKEKLVVVVHFSEEGLAKAKMEKEMFDRGKGSAETELEAETVVQGERVAPLDTKGVGQHPLGNVVPLTDDGNIEGNPNEAMKVNGPTDNIPTHPRTYGTRIPIRPQGLSEHIDDVVRESARTAVMMKGCAKQTTMTKNPANGRYHSADCQVDSSKPVVMTNPPHGAQRASPAHPQKGCNPVQKIEQKGDVTQGHGIDESKESGFSGTSKEAEMEKGNQEMAIRLELHRKIEDEIRRQKRERRILPPPPPPPPKYPPPLPPPLAQRKFQQEQLLMLRHRTASSRRGDLANNDNKHAPSLPPRDQQVRQKGSSSHAVEGKGEEKETNPPCLQFLPPRVAGVPEITVSQQHQHQQLKPGTRPRTRQQQAVLLQGGIGGGAGTDARSRLPVPRIPTHPCHCAEASTAATATAAAITAVRQAEGRSTTAVIANTNTEPQTKPTPTTTTTCRRIPIVTSPCTANRSSLKTTTTTTTTTKTNYNSSHSENKPPSTGTAVSTKTHHPIITTTAAATALKPALEFLKAAVLLLAVVAAVWFLVACMAFDPDSGFWRCRRAGRGTVVSDVVVFALAGLFCVTVGVVGWYVAGFLGLVLSLDWVGLG